MKKLFTLLLLLVSLPLLSQDKDALLKQINQIKKDTDRYLYGLTTLPGEPNPEVSREQAQKELMIQVEAFLDGEEFVYLKEKKTVPDELIQHISCLMRPDTYRSIVYVEKARLLELEQSLSQQLGSDTRKEALQALVNAILEARTVNEVLDAIAASPLSAEIRASQKIDNDTQQYANDGILVYFEPRSKKVLEVMTPMDENYMRRNAKTGEPANPIRYKNAPLWVYVEGLKTSNVI